MKLSVVLAAIGAAALVVVPLALAKAPVAVTGAATSVGATTAVVTGKVDPGGEATSWYVEYGPTTTYGSRTDARSAGNGTAQVDVSEQLRGLTTGVTYHYRLVATNASGTGRGADQTLTTRAAPTVVTGAAASLGPTAATVGGTVDPNGSSTGWWIEYGTSTSYGSRTDTQSAGTGTSPVGVSVRLAGLTAGITYHFRLVAANDLGTTRGNDRSFRTDRAPTVSTGGADAITVSSARVSGSVNPQGRGAVAWFEYGPTTALGSRTGDQDAGFGTRATSVSAQITGLQPGTRYYYRAGARSDAGTAVGQTRSFTTTAGPLVVTGPAQVSGVAVVLTGNVDPVGRATSWWFELGPTTTYGTTTVVKGAGSGRGPVAVSESIAGLAPSTEYHARLVARSSAGTTRGADVAFRTAGAPVVGRTTVSAISLTPRPDRRRRRDERARDTGLGRARASGLARVAERRAGRTGRDGECQGVDPGLRSPPGDPLLLPGGRPERCRLGDGPNGHLRDGGPSTRRAGPAAPLHDRRDEWARPAGRRERTRRHLRARRSRRARRARR